jgi:Alphabaculovirus/Betabaculovirus serine/threonine-protein kinase 1
MEVVGKLNCDESSYDNIYLIKKKGSNQVHILKTINKRIFTYMEPFVHEIMKNNTHFITLQCAVHLPDTSFLIMDYIKDGDLFELVKNSNFKLDENKCRKIILQLVNALNELHKHLIIHNDIKLENLLYNKDKHRLYVCDYGLAHVMGTPSTYDGTNVYFSPEKIKEEPNQASFDWWAVGIVTYEMLSRKYPYKLGHGPHEYDSDGENFNDIEPQALLRHQTKRPPNIKHVSEVSNDFVRRMLTYDITKRLSTYDQIIRHPFLDPTKYKL